VKVKVDPPTANYGEGNSIVSYKSAGAATGGQTTVHGMEHPEAGNTQQTQQQTQKPVAEKPSWAG